MNNGSATQLLWERWQCGHGMRDIARALKVAQ